MILEIILFSAWLLGSASAAIAAFYLLRFIARKIEAFFDRFHR